MKRSIFTLLLFICCVACNNEKEGQPEDLKNDIGGQMVFDKEKWQTKKGADYPYRDQMLHDLVYNDTVRTLNRNEILDLLGEPSYYSDDKNFLYYLISRKRLISWTIHTKTLVVKLAEDNTIEWMKIHD